MSEEQVIGAAHARMSSNMQKERSPEDQVRGCRDRARDDGVHIPDENVFIERAVSGTKTDRAVLNELKTAAKAKRFSVLYVEDLSRLSRESTHLMPLLKELVFDGIRIISINEGIDTDNESWHILATILGLHHEQYITDLGKRVHRGQASAVLDGLSAGDIRFGYASEPVPGTESQRGGRNRRPKMRVIISELARWVVQIFMWFAVDRKSMCWIADELTRLGVPKDHRASTPGWHHDYVKRILTCQKYIGVWRWGRLRNKRHPLTGKIVQVAVPEKDQVVVQREELRIVPQDLWELAQKRLAEIKKTYPGPKGAAGQSGSSYVDLYPKNDLSGLFYCSKCGARFVLAGSYGKYLACGGRRMHRCDVRTHAPRALLRILLIERMQAQLLKSEPLVDELLETVQRTVATEVAAKPDEVATRKAELERVTHKIRNLNALAEEAGCDLRSTAGRIAELEARQGELTAEIRQLEQRCQKPGKAPTRDWLMQQLHDLGDWLADDPRELADVFRAYTGGRIEMTAVIPPGKKRGYFQARFKGNVFAVVADRARRNTASDEDCESACLLQRACRDLTSLETAVVIGVTPLSRAEQLADKVRQLRERGVLWKDIRRLLGCGYSTAMPALSGGGGDSLGRRH